MSGHRRQIRHVHNPGDRHKRTFRRRTIAVLGSLITFVFLVWLEASSRRIARETKHGFYAEVFLPLRDRDMLNVSIEERVGRSLFEHGASMSASVCRYNGEPVSLEVTPDRVIVHCGESKFEYSLPGR